MAFAPAAGFAAVAVAPPVTFAAPAGARPAGALDPLQPFAQILPSGRIVRPTGRSVVVGMNALGVALTPDGRYAVVTNDDERLTKTVSAVDPRITGGYSLAVVDTQTMTVVDRYAAVAGESFFAGILALRDPANPANVVVLAAGGPSDSVFVFDLDASGHLTADLHRAIAVPPARDAQHANDGKAFPGSLVASADGSHAYVVNNLGDDVATIDVASRTIVGTSIPVGFFPFGAAVSRAGLLVLSEGLMAYGKLATPTTAPPFAAPPPDLQRASSLWSIGTTPDALLTAARATVPLDRPPDGLRVVGGAHPSAVVAMRAKPYAFIAMSGADRIATVGLGTVQPRALGGTELRLYDRGPYGTEPSALALSHDEKRLYVALAGIDAVAVLDATDPLHLHRIGLIPTGWYPTALALSPDGRTLFVANAKGFNHDRGFAGGEPSVTDSRGRVLQVDADSNAVWATLERIDLATVNLRKTTLAALADLRVAKAARHDPVVPQHFGMVRPASPIKHVVFLLEENKTYDSMLGDLTDAAGAPYGPGDPALVSFDASVTPNLHALARTFGVAGNFFADAEESDAGHQFAAGGIASLYTEKTLLVKRGRRPLVNKNEDPEDYPRAGYIFDSLLARNRTFRDYGDFVRLSGYDEGSATDPRADDPPFVNVTDTKAPTQGLGGLYSLDAPALLALSGHVDMNYPGWNLRIRDERRAREFLRDFDELVKAGNMPEYTYVWLPADHGGAGANIPSLPEEVADGDRALGLIVDYLSHLPEWSSTAIFITPDDAQSTRDHVNEHRSYAIVVSPYAKRHYLGMTHLSTASVLKTEEELLGLPALSLGDELATDMRDFFTPLGDVTPYQHVDVPVQQASVEGARIGALLSRTDLSAPDADPRAETLIDLSRRADGLARRRATLVPAAYADAQRDLYARALAVVD